ncbi:hypothetical protein K2Y00_03520 [Patescibacteria group bacterium]|nr:hypothetical protein [Patescibacteria group bacterium]
MRRALLGIAVVVLTILVWPVSGPTVTVEVSEEGFLPSELTVAQGTTVTFVNVGSTTHWPASNVHPTHSGYPGSGIQKCATIEQNLVFDSCAGITSGNSYSFTFHTQGAWTYHDHLAPTLQGRVTVSPVPQYQEPFLHAAYATIVRFPEHLDFFIRDLFIAPGEERIAGKYTQEDLKTDTDYSVERILDIAENPLEVLRAVHQIGVVEGLSRIFEESGYEATQACHVAAHEVGRAGFQLFGIKVFEQCTTACHSGCYHGALEELATAKNSHDLLQETTAYCGSLATPYERYQCFHGVGHGYMIYSGYDLPAAVHSCRLLGEGNNVGCYTGVFMENLAQADNNLSGREPLITTWISPEDAHFPCSQFPDDALVSAMCYSAQISVAHALLQDLPEIIEFCNDAPAHARALCFRGIGRELNGFHGQKPSQAEQMCAQVPSSYYSECIIGASKLAIDSLGLDTTAQAAGFCAGFSDTHAKSICYEFYSSYIPTLFISLSTQEGVCARFETPFDAACMESLPTEP